MKTCPYCGTPVSQEGCESCVTAMAKYWEQNQVIVDAYINAMVAEIYTFLAPRARFADWLSAHGYRLVA